MQHYWVTMVAPEGKGLGVEGIVSEKELQKYLEQGFELRSKMAAQRVDAMEQVAVSI